MQSDDTSIGGFIDARLEQLGPVADYLPGILGAIVVLVFGWFLARLVRRGVRAAANASNRLVSQTLSVGPMSPFRISPLMTTLLGEIFFWIVVTLAVAVALRLAGLEEVAQWLDRVALHLPNLIAASLILIVGYLLSVFVREQIAPDSVESDAHTGLSVAFATQMLIIGIALIIALDQMGVEVFLLIVVVAIGMAAVAATLGATFALGAKRHAANLIGIRSARTRLHAGQWIRIDEHEGQIVELSSGQIVLDTDHGRILLPGYFLDEKVVTIVDRPTANSEQDND